MIPKRYLEYNPIIPRFTLNFQLPSFKTHSQQVKKPTVSQTKKFYRNKRSIIPSILDVTEPHEVIHGERAVQQYIPKRLHRHTTDIDIFTNTPRIDALEAERRLDKRFGGDVFFTEQGQHEGTWRVKSRTDGQAYADYTKPENGMPPFKTIRGFNYVTKSYIQKHNKKVLQDPEAYYRHQKDKDTLNRLKIGWK